MKHGLIQRFRAMEDVGRMWQRQARLGMHELEQAHERDRDSQSGLLHPNAFEVDSNHSLAPSQSASQVGYGSDTDTDLGVQQLLQQQRLAHQQNASRNKGRGGHVPGIMLGGVAGSIAEEDESGSEDGGNLVVHENTRGPLAQAQNTTQHNPSPLRTVTRRTSQSTITNENRTSSGNIPTLTTVRAPTLSRRVSAVSSIDSGMPAGGGTARRAQSEIGRPGSSRRNRMSMARTPSEAHSDASSVRSMNGKGRKKGGFFASLALSLIHI